MDQEIVLLLVGVLLTSIGAGIGWYLRQLGARISGLKAKIDDTNQIIRRELRPNGGVSMFDRVTEIEHRLRDGDHTMKNLATNIQQLLDK